MKTDPHPPLPWALALLTLLLPPLHAEDKAPARTAARHEIWVPSKDWSEVLKNHPSAVVLSPEQYQALIRDAGRMAAPKVDENLPTTAVMERLHFTASAVDESAELLRIKGELDIRCLTDAWTEITARLPFRNLAGAVVDGNLVLGLPEDVKTGQTTASQRKLLVRGKGLHRISLDVLGRPGTTSLADTRSFAFHTIDAPATLDLQLPPKAVITQATASYAREGDIVHVLLHAPGPPDLRSIAWTTSSAIVQPARQASATGQTAITDHSIATLWDLEIQRSTTDTAGTIAFDVVPPVALVLSVEGPGITRWQQNAGRLEVTLRDRTHGLHLQASVQSVIDLQASAQPQSIALPVLRFIGQHAKDSETRIASMAEGVTLMEFQGAVPGAGGAIRWNPLRDTLKLLLRKADPRISVDADTHVSVTRDDVQIDRTLVVRTDRPLNELRVTLPAGEEFLSTQSSQGEKPEWKRAGQTLEYRWPSGLSAAQSASLQLSSRKRLNAATPLNSFVIENVVIADAKKLAGYTALDFDPTWRVNVKSANGLEERDARTTPVKGRMAWFALRTFSLAFDVQRRAPVYDADITAYALPRAKTVEIEGQITLNVSDAPLRQLKVVVARNSAALVRFTSPLVGEQTLDAATGTWSLTLRKESLGILPVRFRLSLPATSKDSATAGTVTLDSVLPTLSVIAVRRQHGMWIVEANTDTELTFEPKAMQPMDVLRAPAIQDYEPRHRLVAAYEYAAPDATLALQAARHGHSELAALVVSDLRLTSVLSKDGSTRHEAVLSIQHSGEQFVNVRLPADAQLLTAMVETGAVKPVRGPEGTLSIPLPPGSSNEPDVPVRLLYETPGTPWTSSGKRELQPVILPGDIPILATDWQVFVPDGYSFGKVDTTLEQEGTGMGKGLRGSFPGIEDESVSFLSGGGNLPPFASFAEPRETARAEDARQAVEKGDKLYAEGDYEAALGLYRAAIDTLPNAPAAQEWRDLAKSRFADASVALARNRAKNGRYKEAHMLLDDVLANNSDHKAAKRLKKDLDDPDRFPAAFSPEYDRKVEAVQGDLTKGNSYADLGDYDNAVKSFNEVLRSDPYNIAARRGIERAEQLKGKYYDSARDRTRAHMFNQVNEAWEEKNQVGLATLDKATYYVEKMKMIRFPSIQFDKVTIEEALEFIRMKSRDVDESERDPSRKGVNVILKQGDFPNTAPITLDLKDVPMEEALRYVTELAGMKYKVEPYAVLVVPVTESTTEQYTRVYKVPPDFLTMGADSSGDAVPADPFAPNSGKTTSALRAKLSAKDILQSQGIPFPEGASAVFNAATSQLILKNTSPNLDLVETFVDSLKDKADPNAPPPITAIEFAIDWPDTETSSPLESRMQLIRLPSVQMDKATLAEAVEFLNLKANDVKDLEGSTRPLSIVIRPDVKPGPAGITLDLKDVPLVEALRYIAELAGVKFQIEGDKVVIVPGAAIELRSRAWAVPTTFPQLANINGPVQAGLEGQGIPFPAGASASYDRAANRLTVKNTQPNLGLVEVLLETLWNQAHEKPPIPADEVRRRLSLMKKPGSGSTLFPGAGSFAAGQSFKEGLLPLELDIPSAGQRLHFHGPQAPVALALGYVSWDRQILHACLLVLAGAGLFVGLGRQRPWLSSLLALIVLRLGTGLWMEDWRPQANAVLIGWLVALVLSGIWKLIKAYEAGMMERSEA